MQKVRVIAVASFENIRKGDEGLVDLTPRIKAIIKTGYLRVVEDVPLPDRPRGRKSSEQGSSKAGAADRRTADVEPGADPDASEHGPAEGI